ncbi:putative phosphodiesterase [Duganella sp. 1224]|uniref:metallophosphoesterase family protein n=1 Tax=Duganella sp. 1224 TaxID=2587052 RepID=UPI0015C9C797|nr:metallophosphoesterase family protein [Duganella sp. 1224]NYE62374.1 putative phosphodiesterase [Duganella sp. 1224]
MRIAIVSDIHGNLPALEAVVSDLARRGVDVVVNLGDSLSGPLLPLATARYLMARDWVQLAGNHERQILHPHQRTASDTYAHAQLGEAELAWLATLPQQHRLAADVLLCHGTPRSDHEYFLETVEQGGARMATAAEIDARLAGADDVGAALALIACGHSHVPRAMRASAGSLIVNPGSVGLQAYDDDHLHYHTMQTGAPDARYAIAERGAAGWSAALIAVPYDWRPMAALAARNGRPDWAHAIATGYALQH